MSLNSSHLPTSETPSSNDCILSIMIVNYNVRDLLENTIHSIEAAMKEINGEIFLIDNASDDGSAEMIERQFPSVHLIKNESNYGFAKANNQALKLASGKYFLILNPDTLLQEDTLQVMLRFLEENPDIGMAGCKIIESDGSFEPNSRRSFPSPWVSFTKLSGLSRLFPKSKLFGRYNLTYLSDDETYEIDALSGCFTMLRREVYDQIGGFDEDYFMYGEDLDWCFRAQKRGWKIYYVHSTKIIHYGGESTKRSNIDAKAVFYNAMKLFVKKNLSLSFFSDALITIGIKVQLGIARTKYVLTRSLPVAIDMLLVVGSIVLGEFIRFGGVFTFPTYAYPTVYLASIIIYLFSLFVTGTYTQQEHLVTRSSLGVLIGFLIMSSLTFFFKDFAFSRGVVLIACCLLLILIPGRRILYHIFSSGKIANAITGNPTLLVGVNDQLSEIINKLRSAHTTKYQLVGIIDTDRKKLGREINGVKIIGSTANIGKVIFENGITNVIFLPDVLSYSEIFSIISRTKGTPVHYRMVARSMEFIIGKAGIDQLASVPLIDVDYNLVRMSNIISKRMFDVVISFIGLIALYPFVYFLFKKNEQNEFTFNNAIRHLPQVFAGSMSLVGRWNGNTKSDTTMYLGKPGITGLVHLQQRSFFTQEEMLKLELQYARNHSIFLDLEILFRTLIKFVKKQ